MAVGARGAASGAVSWSTGADDEENREEEKPQCSGGSLREKAPGTKREDSAGQRRSGGVAKGTPRSPQYGHGRTRALPSLPQVLAENDLPEIAPLAEGERVMLERKRLDTFYRELQTPSRIQANTPTPQVEETEEDFKSELTQS